MKQSRQRTLTLIYYAAVILTLSTALPVLFYFLGFKYVWRVYTAIYFSIIFIYIWYRFVNLAVYDFKKNKTNFTYDAEKPFTIVMPCYNEEPDLLISAVASIQRAKGKKEIIIVDDGSNNGVDKTIEYLKTKYSNIRSHRFSQNKGKRHALYWAFQNINTEYFVATDSDTIFGRESFVKLLAPFSDKKIGATTGNILLLNEKENLLTKVIAGMYLCGLDNYKKSQSTLGNVVCCSGCLAAYRTDAVKQIADQFVTQKFRGVTATHSEDRHLTNLILEKQYKVVYVDDAVCYTQTPSTLRNFLKQQQRWKRGFVRETIYLLSHSYRTSKMLFFEALIGNALPYFLSFGMQTFIVITLFFEPSKVYTLLGGWIAFMVIRELPMFISQPKRAIWYVFYIPLYEIFLFWQNMFAIFTVNRTGWLTRGLSNKPTQYDEIPAPV